MNPTAIFSSLSQVSTTNFLYFAILRTLGPTQEFSRILPEIHSGAGETTFFMLLFTFKILKHLFRSVKASSSEMLPPFQAEMIRCFAVYSLSKVGFGLTVSIKKKEIFEVYDIESAVLTMNSRCFNVLMSEQGLAQQCQ
jgi:hypothetical protein